MNSVMLSRFGQSPAIQVEVWGCVEGDSPQSRRHRGDEVVSARADDLERANIAMKQTPLLFTFLGGSFPVEIVFRFFEFDEMTAVVTRFLNRPMLGSTSSKIKQMCKFITRIYNSE